jgi:hypothetical protein
LKSRDALNAIISSGTYTFLARRVAISAFAKIISKTVDFFIPLEVLTVGTLRYLTFLANQKVTSFGNFSDIIRLEKFITSITLRRKWTFALGAGLIAGYN